MEYTQLIVTLLAFVLCMVKGDTRPNIIFIFTDDWGWNDVSYNGGTYLQTDFIDSLAKDGLILSQHYVLPTCTPSRAALLTGRYPANLGLQHSTISPGAIYGVPLESKFIGDELQSYGYSTHMIGKWHLGFCAWEYTPLYRGFDSFSGFFLGAESYSSHNRSVGDMNGFDLRRGKGIVEDADGVYSTYWHYNELTDLFTELEDQEDPFFIYLAWQNSHNPPEAPKSYLKQYKDIAKGSRWFFMGQTAVLDDVMEDVVDELKAKNLWDNTLIVFSSDNGAQKDSGDNAPLRGSKSTLWEGAIRVPAFVTGGYLPDNMRGTTSDELIHVTDWYMTFVNLANSNDNSDIESIETDGYDVSNVILNGESTERDEFLINVDSVNCGADVCGALRYQKYKMIIGGSGVTSSEAGKSDCFWVRDYMSDETNENGDLVLSQCGTVPEDVSTDTCGCQTTACLFDLESDPCEYYDLSENDEYSDIYDKMYEKLSEYYNNQVHPWKDIYQTDYDNADPKLFDNFWSPWLTKEEAVKKQELQYTVFKLAQSQSSDSSAKMLHSGESLNLHKNMFNETSTWIVVSFILCVIIASYIICKAKSRFQRVFTRSKQSEANKTVENNPLLSENNSVYNSVGSN